MKTAIKNVLGIWIDIEQKVKYSTILVFKVIFLCQKSAESFWIFVSLKTKNGPKYWPSSLNPSKSREHFYGRFHGFLAFFIFFNEKKINKDLADFWHRKMTLKTRIVLHPSKYLEHFYGHFHRPLALLTHHSTLLSSTVQVRSLYYAQPKKIKIFFVYKSDVHYEIFFFWTWVDLLMSEQK